MDVKEAVDIAKRYFADLFAGEDFRRAGLEEVNFDDATGIWEITIGFVRPLDSDTNNALSNLLRPSYTTERSYKIVRISDATGRALSVKNREPKS
jgi:hypothetical protein